MYPGRYLRNLDTDELKEAELTEDWSTLPIGINGLALRELSVALIQHRCGADAARVPQAEGNGPGSS